MKNFPTSFRPILLAFVVLLFVVSSAMADDVTSAKNTKHVPWLDEIQKPPEVVPQGAPRLPNLPSGQAWEQERGRIRDDWLDFLGPLSRAERKLPDIEIVEEDRVGGVIRQLIRYKVEKDQVVEAYLIRPHKKAGKRPAVAVFHSTVDHSILQPAGVEGNPAKAFGIELARRGYVTISPRNYLWPETRRIAAKDEARKFTIRHPESKGMARMLLDAQIAIDILVAERDVDPGRIGAVGHSLGAKEVLYLAAFDERVRATVSSEGGISTTFSNWDAAWYLGETIKADSFQHEHHELLALVAPRAFLLIGGDSADGDRGWPFIEAALPVYQHYNKAGRPRFGQFNHRKGHAVPKEAERRIYEWLDVYLEKPTSQDDSEGKGVWPAIEWSRAAPEDVDLDPEKLRSARDYAVSSGGSGGSGYITRHGKLVLSWGDARRRYDLKSSTKSIGVTALALAIKDGKMALSDRATKHHPGLGEQPKSNNATGWLEAITIRHLSTQTAGFEKGGGYEKIVFKPGSKWLYSDGGPNWLAECITLVYRRDLEDLMFERVFTPIGISRKDLTWRRNAYRPREIEGIPRREFGAGIHADVDAMARIGYLYLRGGRWKDRQVIPENFVSQARQTVRGVVGLPEHAHGYNKSMGNASDHYGLLWWNNADGSLENVPRSTYWSWGLFESLIVVMPEFDIVVSRACAGKSWKRRAGKNHYDVLRPFLEPIVQSVKGRE